MIYNLDSNPPITHLEKDDGATEKLPTANDSNNCNQPCHNRKVDKTKEVHIKKKSEVY